MAEQAVSRAQAAVVCMVPPEGLTPTGAALSADDTLRLGGVGRRVRVGDQVRRRRLRDQADRGDRQRPYDGPWFAVETAWPPVSGITSGHPSRVRGSRAPPLWASLAVAPPAQPGLPGRRRRGGRAARLRARGLARMAGAPVRRRLTGTVVAGGPGGRSPSWPRRDGRDGDGVRPLGERVANPDRRRRTSTPASVVSMLLIAAAFFVVALALARGLRAAGRVVGRWVGRLLPARVATVVGGLVVAMVVYLAITGVAHGPVAPEPGRDVHGGQQGVLDRRPGADEPRSSRAVRGRR